jgi:hypothetical protein
LDVTFQGTDISDGGILIRGLRNEDSQLKTEERYINGPRRVLETIFKNFNPVTNIEQQFGLIQKAEPERLMIFKTIRHGLSKTQNNSFKDNPYRYYVDLSNWRKEHVNDSVKKLIESESKMLEV